MKALKSYNITFLHRRWRSLVAKRDIGEVDSGDTFNRLSLTTRSLRSLKPLERQECATLYESPGRAFNDVVHGSNLLNLEPRIT
ncbi:hypothetical protein [Paenibacillus crassostreae]|uniref:hypothetical protein n=1 Tax=Paenibacillus crassostreae TaxID=1763538 RepID=UPI0012FE6B43|nr:hypothetical protein [Paenibacillus crassostreae]